MTAFAVTGREASIGLHGGVQDATEERSRGAEEGGITDSAVCDASRRGRHHR